MPQSLQLPNAIIERLQGLAHASGYTIEQYLEVTLQPTRRPIDDIAEKLPDLICTINEEGIFTFVNAAWQRVLGYEKQALLNQPFLAFIHPEDHIATMREFDRIVLEGHHTLAFENRYRTVSGDYRWFSWTTTRIENDGIFYAIARDVTENKQNTASIRADKQQISIILESISDAFFALDSNWQFTYINQHAEQLLQRKRADLLGQNVWQEFPEARNLNFLTYYEQVMNEKVTAKFIEYYPPLELWFEVSAYPAGDGISVYFHDVTGRIAMEQTLQQLIDTLEQRVQARTRELEKVNLDLKQQILERKQVEATLREKERLFELLTNHTSDLICLHTPEGNYLYLSPSCRDLLGYDPQELIGVNPYTLFHPDDQKRIRETAHDVALEGEQVLSLSYRIQHKDGRYTWFESYTQPVLDSDGQVIQLVTASRDITAAKTLEAELRDALAKAHELNDFKSRFVSMVSHEFRTPLATIRSSADLIRRYYARMTEEQRQNHMRTIHGQISHLTEMLNLMMEINRAHTVGLKFNPEPVDIISFCEAMLKELRPLAEPSHQLIFEPSGLRLVADLDTRLMHLIISNLISNAIKYSPHNKSIWLHLDCNPDDNTFTLAVRDSGIGIPADEIEHIFEEFHRAANVGKIEGTGLGLTLVYQAVLAHSGSISVQSKQHEGTTFTLLFPLRQAVFAS